MAVPDAIANFVLENINQALQNNPPSLLVHVKENLEKLRRQLMSVKILLEEFSKYNSDSKFVKQTAKEIKQVLVEAEDAVDTYVHRASVQNSKPWIPKALLPIALRNLERRIAEVTEKFKQINEEKPRTGFHVLQYQSIRNPSRHGNSTQALVVEGEPLVGLDEGPIRDVKTLLIELGTKNFEVVSIAGMPGLGKTTLARKVYEDPDIEDNYDIRAFVYVSRTYNKKALLLQILASCIPISDQERSMGLKGIEKLVYKKLEGKRYLIVLDDVWMPKDWDIFKGVFPNNNINVRCRVLITTRNAIVAEYANPQNSDSLYKLGFLNQNHSQELLQKRVFGDKSFDHELKNYVKRIASACDGLPLVILLIAGVISSDPHKVEWWKEIFNAINDARRATRVTEKIYKNQATQVTEIVYKYLPNHLKPCFLYLAMFPANFEIPVWKLVRFWISEGFIRQEDNTNLEDTAERYLKQLIDRHLAMIGRKRSNGRIKTVVMLETLRNFCKNEAKRENIFREARVSFFLSGGEGLDQCRRLCIINADTLDYFSAARTAKSLRSFLTFLEKEEAVGERLARIPKTFRLLKVVEAESLVFTRFPADFSSLVLLKYLAISIQLSTIPSTLSALKNLQTLIANTTSQTLNIKANIWEMPQFRHLHTNASATLPSPVPKSHKIKHETPSNKVIQTLCNVAPQVCQREVFEKTRQLKKLGIYGNLAALVQEDGGPTLLEHLRDLESLENLKLVSNVESSAPILLLRDLPRHLTNLTLQKTRLDWEEMSQVGKVETLEVLKLKEYAFQGATWKTEAGGFLGLVHLYVGETDLKIWEDASVAQFPKLRSLEINGCEKLEVLPPGLADIPSLQSVALHRTNTQLVSSAKKLKQDYSERKAFRLSVYPPPEASRDFCINPKVDVI